MIDLVDIAITSGGTPSLPLPTRLSPALAMLRLDCGAMEDDMTCTFFGDVARLEDAVEELGMTEEEIRGPRLFNETPPHLGLLGTGFLQKNGTLVTFVKSWELSEKNWDQDLSVTGDKSLVFSGHSCDYL